MVNSLPQKRSSRLRLYGPPVLLVLAGVALSGFWMFAKTQAERGLDQWMVQEAAAGRVWTCDDRVIGGYPFRIELNCLQPTLRQTGADPFEATMGRVLAVAQIYQADLAILEFEGPFHQKNADGTFLAAKWESLRASVHLGADRTPDRLSVEIKGAEVESRNAVANGAIRHAEFHARVGSGQIAADDLDVAVAVGGAVFPLINELTGVSEPMDITLRGSARQAMLLKRGLVPSLIDQWAQTGGKMIFDEASLKQPGFAVSVKGEVTLDAQRRPKGQLELNATGAERLLAAFGIGGKDKGVTGLLGALLGQKKSDGTQKVSTLKLPVRLGNGKVAVGPIVLAELGPLY